MTPETLAAWRADAENNEHGATETDRILALLDALAEVRAQRDEMRYWRDFYRAEAQRMNDALDRVRSLADEWEGIGANAYAYAALHAATRVRAALDGA